MKNIYIIPFLFSCLLANAQSEIGVKGGINFSNLDGSFEKYDLSISNRSVYAGLFVAVKVSPSFYFQPEINFSQQGGKRIGMQQVPAKVINAMNLVEANLYADFKNSATMNYMEIPLLAKFLFGGKIKYYASFGPYIAFRTNARMQTSGNGNLYLNQIGTIPYLQKELSYPPVSLYHRINIKEDIKRINAGVQAALGIRYPLGSGNIILEYRAIMGITNIQSHPGIDGENQTSSLVVLIGYSIKIK